MTLDPFDLAHLAPLLSRDAGAPSATPDTAPAPEFRMRPVTMPGTIRGTLRGSGYIDDLAIVADLTLHDPEPGTPPSYLQARGGVGVGEEFLSLRDLDVEVEAFESRWTRLIGLNLGVDGRFQGALTLDREQDTGVAFDGAVEHFTPAGDLSRFSGGGFLNLAQSQVDASIDANPLALSLLRPWTSGIDLAGTVTGPIQARGSLDAMELAAELESERGQLTLNGDFDLASEVLRYDTEIEGVDSPSISGWRAPRSRGSRSGGACGGGAGSRDARGGVRSRDPPFPGGTRPRYSTVACGFAWPTAWR